jgi:hypothetical protein
MTVTGKIRKVEMREAMMAELDCQITEKGFESDYCSNPFTEKENKIVNLLYEYSV